MISIMLENVIDRLRRLAVRQQELAVGEILFRVDEAIHSLFVVVGGELRLHRTLPSGLQVTLQRAPAHSILAEASLFARRYHCDATAIEASAVSVVPRHRIMVALSSDATFALALAGHLAHEVHRTRAHAEVLSLRTVAARVDAWLALNDGAMPRKGRWRQMASEIGVTPEALYRELARRSRSLRGVTLRRGRKSTRAFA